MSVLRPIQTRRLSIAIVMAIVLVGAASRLDARVELFPCKNSISPEQQIKLGQTAARQISEQMPLLPDSSPETGYVQALGLKLAAQAPGYKWPFNFHVVDVSEINAFALPGGSIFVNLGTLQAADNEAQLAAVIAHEISHVVLQHSVCNAERQQRVGLIAGLGQIAAGLVLGNTAGQLAERGIGLTTGLGFLKMSREAEQQADLMGVGILYDAGYDPHAMPQFFETLQQKYGKGSAQFLSDHPNPGNRSEYIDKEIADFVPRGRYVTNSPAFVKVHAEVAYMHAYTSKEVASGVWKRQSPNQTVSGGINQLGGEPAQGVTSGGSDAGTWKTFRGTDFSLQVPDNWQAFGSPDAAMLGPQGGISRSANGGPGNLIYGMLTDRYQPGERTSVDSAFQSLVNEIAHNNPGLQLQSQQRMESVAGVSGRSVECGSTADHNGRGEHDWIVAFQQNDGSLRYFVFVAPTTNFEQAKPTFAQMLHSVRFD